MYKTSPNYGADLNPWWLKWQHNHHLIAPSFSSLLCRRTLISAFLSLSLLPSSWWSTICGVRRRRVRRRETATVRFSSSNKRFACGGNRSDAVACRPAQPPSTVRRQYEEPPTWSLHWHEAFLLILHWLRYNPLVIGECMKMFYYKWFHRSNGQNILSSSGIIKKLDLYLFQSCFQCLSFVLLRFVR